jgi:hypothetical protein
MMFYLLLHVRWVDIIIYIRRKIERGEKHWEVGNLYKTLFHKKDGKFWFSYLQCRGEIQMKNLLIIVFCRIDYNKIEEKGYVQKTLTIALFDFTTSRHHISLIVFTTFGRSSCGSPHLEFLKLEERKRWQWDK